MKWINLSELFRQPDWPQTLTQQQHNQLVQDKLDRAFTYRLLHGHFTNQEDSVCFKPIPPQSHGAQLNK